MKRIDKDGKRKKLNIIYVYKKDGESLENILKNGYLSYIKKLNLK